MNPEVLLFDEPTAALDPRTQQWLMELIVELNDAGKTIVLATHDLSTLTTLADRCVVFSEEHRIVADGTPAAILGDRDLLLSVNLIHDHSHTHYVPTQGQPVRELVHSHDHDASHHLDGHHTAHEPHQQHLNDQITWSVPVTCEACEHKIEAAIRPLTGINSIYVDVPGQLVHIRYQPARIGLSELRSALDTAGYPPSERPLLQF